LDGKSVNAFVQPYELQVIIACSIGVIFLLAMIVKELRKP